MFLVASVLLFFIEFSSSQVVQLNKNQSVVPSVRSGFFDLGGMFGQLFPDFNQGNQGGSQSNPGGMGFPTNSQFYPDAGVQNQIPTTTTETLQTQLPPIDDASTYPIAGHANSQKRNPGQGNFGPQPVPYPNQGGYGGLQNQPNPEHNGGGQMRPPYPNQGNFGSQMPYPNQGNFGGPQQMPYPNRGNGRVPQRMPYPNQGNFGGTQSMPYPNQGNFGGNQQMPYPNQGNVGANQQVPSPNQGNVGGNQQMPYPNQGNFGGTPQMPYPNQGNVGANQQMPYPNQGNFGGTQQMPYPNPGNSDGLQQFPLIRNPNTGSLGGSQQMPNQNQGIFGGTQPVNSDQGSFGGEHQFVNPQENGYPQQTEFPNMNNMGSQNRPGDGTLDDFMPPQQPPYTDSNNFMPGQNVNDNTYSRPVTSVQGPKDGTVAILGNPVIVPPMRTASPDQIFFPSSTENPSMKQCVQDCETSSEYEPVCGSDNITYINPGKFVCARNCGVNVFVARQGRCPKDTPHPRS